MDEKQKGKKKKKHPPHPIFFWGRGEQKKMDTFSRYVNQLFLDPNDFLRDWDFDLIESDYLKWKTNARWLKIYVLANNCPSFATHTHIGCVEDVNNRVDQHNGRKPGGPSETKRAFGHWKLMCYVIVPPFRNYSSVEIKKQCKTGRGWQNRCSKALSIAFNNGLDFKIAREIFDPSSDYYTKELVEAIKNNVAESDIVNTFIPLEQKSSDSNVEILPKKKKSTRKRKREAEMSSVS